MAETRIAIVTAASKGIGAGCAEGLHRAGFKLVLMSRSGDVDALAKRLDAVAVRGSVLDTADLKRLVDTAMERFGRIDAVVNNTGHGAGTTQYTVPQPYWAKDIERRLLDIADEDWHHGLDLYMLNVVRMARLVTPIMQAQGGGAIVNISSMAANEPRPSSPMSIVRGALHGFVKLYADRYGRDGIRMNNLSPGFMENVELTEAIRDGIPLSRSGTMREVGDTCAFLCSPASGYITGQNILHDGGLNRSSR